MRRIEVIYNLINEMVRKGNFARDQVYNIINKGNLGMLISNNRAKKRRLKKTLVPQNQSE
jgi:hypothetical protein